MSHATTPMQEALALAAQSTGLSDPNPRVGCVFVDAGLAVLGSGHTQPAGDAHAEIDAMQCARAAGHDLHGATAYVTLEPCSHHGRTPPCCDALIDAGIAKVVVAIEDPNPRVAGRGIARLRAAGVEVEMADSSFAHASRELNIGFFSRMIRKRPWVRMKLAASLDGRTALPSGESQWITGEPARTDGHAFRKRAGAVLTGAGTVLEDDPRLDVRLVPTALQPLRVIVDSRLDTPPSARILRPPGSVLIYAAAPPPARLAPLLDCGADIVDLPGPHGKVDLSAMLEDLARREINELHVEAGHKLNGSFVREDLVDEFLLYIAPKLLGEGAGLAAIGPLANLAQAPQLAFHSVERIGEDLRLLARPPGRDAF